MTEISKPAPASATELEQADTQPSAATPHLVSLTHAQRVQLFGRFAFTSDPEPGNPEHVVIAEPWVREHIVTVNVPQLARNARVHKLIAKQFLALWAAWEAAGLLGRVLTFDGSWVSRFKRQPGTPAQRAAACKVLGEQALSNHAWGTAFDIDAAFNPLGATPAAVGAKGCTRELVPIAALHGFAWGGDFHSRPDGMHFEAARVIG